MQPQAVIFSLHKLPGTYRNFLHSGQSVVESHTKLVYKYIKQDVEAENNHTAKGRVEQMGTPTEIYKNPKTPFVAQFIGQSAIITDYDRLKGFHLYPGTDRGYLFRTPARTLGRRTNGFRQLRI